MSWSATAVCSVASVNVTINGAPFFYQIPNSITATAEGSTESEAKQNARKKANLEAFVMLHQEIETITVADAGALTKGRVATNYDLWLKTDIVNVWYCPN